LKTKAAGTPGRSNSVTSKGGGTLKKIVIIVVIVVVVVAVVALGLRGRKTEIPDVRIVTVERGTITKAVVATGEIRPLAVAEVKSKIGGVVRRFYVEEGDEVGKGQKLAEIVPAATPEELVYARESVKTAKLQLEQAQRKLKRLEDLADKQLISEEETEEAETELSIYAARYDAALAELQVLEQGSAGRGKGQADIGAETAEALIDMIITSPISGIVLSRNVDEGSSVIAMSSAYGGTSLMTLADVSTMHFEGDVDESDVAKIRAGMPAKIYVDAFPDTTLDGILTRIAPQGIKEEGVVNFRVEAELMIDTGLLRTGMSADVQLVLDERHDVLTVPEGAVIYEGDSTFVESIDAAAEGGKRRLPVKVGLSDGIKTEIVSGLPEGEELVLQ
jgi:HlyD family secretion protein